MRWDNKTDYESNKSIIVIIRPDVVGYIYFKHTHTKLNSSKNEFFKKNLTKHKIITDTGGRFELRKTQEKSNEMFQFGTQLR